MHLNCQPQHAHMYTHRGAAVLEWEQHGGCCDTHAVLAAPAAVQGVDLDNDMLVYACAGLTARAPAAVANADSRGNAGGQHHRSLHGLTTPDAAQIVSGYLVRSAARQHACSACMRTTAHNLSTQPARRGLLPSTLTIPALLRGTGMQQARLILLRSVALTQLARRCCVLHLRSPARLVLPSPRHRPSACTPALKPPASCCWILMGTSHRALHGTRRMAFPPSQAELMTRFGDRFEIAAAAVLGLQAIAHQADFDFRACRTAAPAPGPPASCPTSWPSGESCPKISLPGMWT